MPHDFKHFPELTNSQMDFYYFESPHKQIFESFFAEVSKVVDGDTIRVKVPWRDFDFPIRFLNTNAPEMNEGGGESKEWLTKQIINQHVYIEVDEDQRVGKWGRLLGIIIHKGMNMNEMSINMGFATTFDERNEGKLPDIEKILAESI